MNRLCETRAEGQSEKTDKPYSFLANARPSVANCSHHIASLIRRVQAGIVDPNHFCRETRQENEAKKKGRRRSDGLLVPSIPACN